MIIFNIFLKKDSWYILQLFLKEIECGTSINAQYAHYAQYMLTEYCLKMLSDSKQCMYIYI